MRKSDEVFDQAMALLVDYLKSLGSKRYRKNEKYVQLTRYDYFWDECFSQAYGLERIFVEDGEVIVGIRDNHGDYVECDAKDFGMDDICNIIKAIEE